MMTRLEGAMTTTRLPHFENIEGLLIKTKNAMPVPVMSPLSDGYVQQIEACRNAKHTKIRFLRNNDAGN